MTTDDVRNIYTVVGWFVSFSLGLIASGIIVPRLTAKKKILSWAVLSENEIIPREITQTYGLSASIRLGNNEVKSLSGLKIRVGNRGNEVIKAVEIVLKANNSARILTIRESEDLGEFQKRASFSTHDNHATINFEYLNPGFFIDLEITVLEYEKSSITADGAMEGVTIIEQDSTRWEVPASAFQFFGLSILGLHYDPKVNLLHQIAEEIRLLRLSSSIKEMVDHTPTSNSSSVFDIISVDVLANHENQAAQQLARFGIEYYSTRAPLTLQQTEEIVADSNCYKEVKGLLNLLEMYASAVHCGTIDEDMTYSLIATVMIRNFQIFGPLIEDRRAYFGSSAIWMELEVVAKDWQPRRMKQEAEYRERLQKSKEEFQKAFGNLEIEEERARTTALQNAHSIQKPGQANRATKNNRDDH